MGAGSVKFTRADLHGFVRPYIPGSSEYSVTFSGSSRPHEISLVLAQRFGGPPWDVDLIYVPTHGEGECMIQ
jgi:hypothetical protein